MEARFERSPSGMAVSIGYSIPRDCLREEAFDIVETFFFLYFLFFLPILALLVHELLKKEKHQVQSSLPARINMGKKRKVSLLEVVASFLFIFFYPPLSFSFFVIFKDCF